MAAQRTIGITILGGIFIFVGGLTTLFIFFELVDSVNRYGLESLTIKSFEAFRGFFAFAILPMVIYSTGIGILLLRSWARRITVYFIPLCTLTLFATENNLIFWLLIVCLLLIYFNRPKIKSQFE